MRGLRSFASVLGIAAAAAYATPLTSRFGFAPGPIVLGGGSGAETLEDRQRRNAKAGGRDKRIKWNKARGSRPVRRSRASRPLGLSNPFTYQRRKDAFDAAIAAGETRNMAAKLARRVALA